jgi:hypothetical protein
MTIEEFNEARILVREDLIRAAGNPTAENLSQLMIKLALHGLVAVPMDHYPDSIPEPICMMVYIPEAGPFPGRQVVNTFLVPADQVT